MLVENSRQTILQYFPKKNYCPSLFKNPIYTLVQMFCFTSFFIPFSEEVTYQWIYNEFPVFLRTDRRRFVSQKTGNLYIAKVEAQDAGNYSCLVSSPILGKSVYSKFIPLIPLPPDDGQSPGAAAEWDKTLSFYFIYLFYWLRWGKKIPSRHQGEVPGHYGHAGLQHHLRVLCSWKVSFINFISVFFFFKAVVQQLSCAQSHPTHCVEESGRNRPPGKSWNQRIGCRASSVQRSVRRRRCVRLRSHQH